MRRLVFLLFYFSAGLLMAMTWKDERPFRYGEELHEKIAFISHADENPPYLAMNVFHHPVSLLKAAIENYFGLNELKNRGSEAHITVVTPPEYDRLQEKLSMEEINLLAREIQDISFTALCVGKGEKIINKKIESAYFIVVKSEELFALREKIFQAFLGKGGDKSAFLPREYYPHITIGFTLRDLHFSDGIIKDESACIAPLKVREGA